MSPLRQPYHPYLRFRYRMARHALLQFLASLKNSLEILLFCFMPVLLGLFAMIALPLMAAMTLAWPYAVAALAAQALLVAVPVILLRRRLHPAACTAWARALPIPSALAWTADALVAGLLVGPLAVVYAVSMGIWLYQWPLWLRPIAGPAIAATALSLLLGWLLATLVLARRRQPLPRTGLRHTGLTRTGQPATVPGIGDAAAGKSGAPAAIASAEASRNTAAQRSSHDGAGQARAAYSAQALHPFYPALWHRLFWLPCWRAENATGVQQTVLLLAALAGIVLWVWHPAAVIPTALWGAYASLMLILLTDRGDQAVREQSALLHPVLASWPVAARPLLLGARAFSLLPALLVLSSFALLMARVPQQAYKPQLAHSWLLAALAASSAIVGLNLSPRGRVVLVALSTLILTAIGSEVWK
ncbi:hypothetical protein [Massilia sp. YIM B04103]|uniref:hypothetical protein n=1 Tax=Massilia sp. YIM B04103 TaxID=2963106 RepID=UPI002109853E|nr:hypothetical protein [Massilia sp. YIM B04103]